MRVNRSVAALAAAVTTLGGVGLTWAATSQADAGLRLTGIGDTITVSTAAATTPALAAVARIEGAGTNSNVCVVKVSGPGTLKVRRGTSATGLTTPALDPCDLQAKPFISFAAGQAGEYKVRVYEDKNGNGSYDQGIDEAAPVLTMVVADLVPTVTLRAPEDSLGTVTLDGDIKFAPEPTITDVRGQTNGLGAALAAATFAEAVTGPCGTVGQGGNVTVTPPTPAVPVKFVGTQAFTFDLGTAALNGPHNGGTVKVTPSGPESNTGVSDVAWLHSAKPSTIEIMKLGTQNSPNGKDYPLGDSGHLNAVDLVARVSAPGPVRLECPLVDVKTSEGTYVLDGDKAVNDLHAATALIYGVNHPEGKTVEYDTHGDLRFKDVVFTKAGPAKITVTSGDASAAITPQGAVSTDPYVLTAGKVTVEQGKNSLVKGAVHDAFGNPVPNTPVELSGVTGGVGVLDVSSVRTGTDGTWSGRFAADDQAGTGAYSAALPGVASAGAGQWLGTTLTVPATVTALSPSITVGATPEPTALSLSAAGALAGQTIRLSGTGPDGAVVITAKAVGLPGRSVTVTATGGRWTATYPATRTVTFTAHAGTKVTAPVTVKVVTRVTALSVSQYGTGRVRIQMFAQPYQSARYAVSVNGKHQTITSKRVIDLRVGKGRKTITVRATAPGCTTGPARTVVKTVK